MGVGPRKDLVLGKGGARPVLAALPPGAHRPLSHLLAKKTYSSFERAARLVALPDVVVLQLSFVSDPLHRSRDPATVGIELGGEPGVAPVLIAYLDNPQPGRKLIVLSVTAKGRAKSLRTLPMILRPIVHQRGFVVNLPAKTARARSDRSARRIAALTRGPRR